MAILKPIVLKDGRLERLQTGDSLDTGADQLQRLFTSLTNVCSVVYADGAGSVQKAQADAAGTVDALGLAVETVGAGLNGGVITNGQIIATTGEWDAVTGLTGGLTTGAIYFLSAATAGAMVEEGSAPSGAGQYVLRLGTALSTTEFEVRIFPEIKL
jgi:hypothetical protein